MKRPARHIYRVARSVLFTAVLTVVGLVACLCVAVALPPVQKHILRVACREVSTLLGGEVEAGALSISLFDEVVLHDVTLSSPSGERVIRVGTLGAGIDLWRLLSDGRIEITYAEILDMDAALSQAREGGPLNIQFMIDALSPKDRTKPPTKFDLNIRTVVIRRGHLTFDRLWCPHVADTSHIDFNHLDIAGLTVDMSIPRLRNDDFAFHLRRLAFDAGESLVVRRLSCEGEVSPMRLAVRSLTLELDQSSLTVSDLELPLPDGYASLMQTLKERDMEVRIQSDGFVPADLRALLPQLEAYRQPLHINFDAQGNMHRLDLRELSVGGGDGLSLSMSGRAQGLDSIAAAKVELDHLDLDVSSRISTLLMTHLTLPPRVQEILRKAGDIALHVKGVGDLESGDLEGEGRIRTAAGTVEVERVSARGLKGNSPSIAGHVMGDGVDVGALSGVGTLGLSTFDVEGLVMLGGKVPDADVTAQIDYIDFRGLRIEDIYMEGTMENGEGSLSAMVNDPDATLELEAEGRIAGVESMLDARLSIINFEPSRAGLLPQYEGYRLSGYVDADLQGDRLDDLTGTVNVRDLHFAHPDGGKSILLERLRADTRVDADGVRELTLRSDLVDGYVGGTFQVTQVAPVVVNMLSIVTPALVRSVPETRLGEETAFDYDFTVKADHEVLDFFPLPVRPLTDVTIKGMVNAPEKMAEVEIKAPYIQQGKNKLVRDTGLRAVIDAESRTAGLALSTVMPVKFGEMTLTVNATAHSDNVLADIGWRLPEADKMSGKLSLGASFERDAATGGLGITGEITPSDFVMNGAEWHIGGGHIDFSGKRLEVDDLLVSHGDQFVRVAGIASDLPEDEMRVTLANIDLGYIFDTLNINYVQFGGTATGALSGSSLFTQAPQASTERLDVQGLSYNGGLLGDASISSSFDPAQKMVGIKADIHDAGHRAAKIDGGIWVTRDSLSFGVEADRINVEFMRPFMAAFSSGLEGRASGRAKLYGTFKDIDLEGRIHADTIRMKLDFTNTWYGGSDSVILDRGRIVVPSFRIYDREGHSGVFSGELTHKFFRQPAFDFRLRDAVDLLCYDTDARINPDWYGTMYGDGGATITGRPGFVGISIDMATRPGSAFTLVLNDTQAAEDYRFLSFSDRRRAAYEAALPDTVPDFLKRFHRQVALQEETPTNVALDIRATVTPDALMTLVMDPAGGDKITARGSGAMQMEYESESNEMKMFGRYVLDEGNYNFSLQDIILKDFVIRPGSAITFNGDPMNADLDIAATYRVNTNLTDLDKSFANDRELNRTNVPIDAVLMVDGPMTSPDINFDIDLPTLTEDVGRKVKSLISTNDMMSRQIIYLLALNRFYTNEYTGEGGSTGREFSALASSTLSSQLSNVLSTLTDKLTVSPSIRSDKGDFSDMEVDLALSSRLFNNRLLVNGNFGYRDRNTSTTTFVGDFDIEYLLTRNGNLRLKAYNHFNDQNYYLRSALTTQGIGVVLRREFDSLKSFFRRKEEEPSCVKVIKNEQSNEQEEDHQ